MSNVASDQHWGVGAAAWPGAALVRLKGGWGPGTDGKYLVRQLGIIEDAARRGFVVALIVKPLDGSFRSGTTDISELAAAVARATDLAKTDAASACG
jgi:hypothetical protein